MQRPIAFSLEFFLQESGIILDVRTPSEYQQGHLPKSFSIPLLSDQEHTQVGTIYKQKGQKEAIIKGLQLVGPNLARLITSTQCLLNHQTGKIVCWRGGMRSHFIAHVLTSIGLNAITLQGGYKSFRRFILDRLEKLALDQPLLYVLGGLTGSGKTSILQALKELGEQVIDLESMAQHRGSVFGAIGLPAQPSQEQFENDLGWLWSQLDFSRPIWIEDEGRLIGKCQLPHALVHLMRQAPVFYIEKEKEERLHHLLELYGKASSPELIQGTYQLAKRLGSQLTNQIITLIQNNQIESAFNYLLSYYDRAYQYKLNKRNPIFITQPRNSSFLQWAKAIQQIKNKKAPLYGTC